MTQQRLKTLALPVLIVSIVGLAWLSGGLLRRPAVAPAGTGGPILLLRDPAQGADLWRVGLDGQGQLLASHVDSFSSSGGLVSVAVRQPDGSGRLDLLDTTKNITRTMITDPLAALRNPSLQPGGAALVYERTELALRDDEPAPVTLRRSTITAGTAAPVLPDDPAALNAQWSPDGRWLAGETAAAAQLWVIAGDGPAQPLPAYGTFAWAPDSRRVVVSNLDHAQPGHFPELVIVDVQTKQTSVLLSDPQADLYWPSWSPDGASIAFLRRPAGATTGELWVIPSGGGSLSAARQLTADPQFDNLQLAWSGDSQRLFWTRISASVEQPAVWQVSAAGGAPTLFAENAQQPQWLR